MKILHQEDYAARRIAEYPPSSDLLDAKAKQTSNDASVRKTGIDQEAAYYAACLAVKAKYPKP